MVTRCRSSSTQTFSQQTCCIDTICCHVPLMIDWIFISKRWDFQSFVALESTQSHVTTMNYLPCDPNPMFGWVLYQPCQRSHSTPWLTYMTQLLPPESWSLEAGLFFMGQGCPKKLSMFQSSSKKFRTPGFTVNAKHKGYKRMRIADWMSLSLSVSDSSFIWRLDPARCRNICMHPNLSIQIRQENQGTEVRLAKRWFGCLFPIMDPWDNICLLIYHKNQLN